MKLITSLFKQAHATCSALPYGNLIFALLMIGLVMLAFSVVKIAFQLAMAAAGIAFLIWFVAKVRNYTSKS